MLSPLWRPAALVLGLLCTLARAAVAADVPRPTVFLIGDSTVKNGSGKGAGGLWGWGDFLADSFDRSKVAIENRALGGRSSRSYLTEGLWDKVVAALKPGDFVLIQFGHNDGGPLNSGRARASLKGNGDETQEVVIEATGKKETVHTYGWYIRKYIADAKARGATPIVLSPIPRNMWTPDHKVIRASNNYARWAAEAAKSGGAPFIDLNEIVARRYEADGQETVASRDFTAADHTHTTEAGARINAACVVEGIKTLADCPLSGFLARPPAYRFDFGPGKVAAGFTRVEPSMAYDAERGYGFDLGSTVTVVERGGDDALRDGFCTSDRPFFFSVALPEGNYDVTATLGDRSDESITTIKAESRRLMVEKVRTAPGEFATRTFTVNVRDSWIGPGRQVGLKARERGLLHWDDKLTLEFNGKRPCLCALEIKRADDALTVYLAGDSTVTDQPREPWNSWGQMLPRFFKPGVAVANHAESGEALKGFAGARRLDKILSTIRPGDYLFIQFGHNDQKERGENVGPFTTYEDSLKRYIAEARKRGAIPVLVTSMNRRTFDDEGHVTNSLGGYPDAVRQAAAEEHAPLIDLNAMSKPFYEALGPEGSKRAFVDNTHHNAYGSYEFARCVVEGIKKTIPDLARRLGDDIPAFDPAHPDPIERFDVPASPQRTETAPDGS